MPLELDIQNASTTPGLPGHARFRQWAEASLAGRRPSAALSIRLVDKPEGAELNRRFRGRHGATNVLSFPFDSLPGLADDQGGANRQISQQITIREAREQGKSVEAHWAHLVVHGVLHLLGYDHLDTAGATEMEGLERDILLGLGFPAPYADILVPHIRIF